MTDSSSDIRPGETRLAFEPAEADDARLVFVGRVRSPWTTRADCPKNLRAAREAGVGARVEIDEAFRPALASLEVGSWIFLLSWLHMARRDLAMQMPRHAERPTSTFALRSPVRPNPIGLHLVRLLASEQDGAVLAIDAIDLLDGTPIIDIKPYFASVDCPPEG